MMSRFILSLMLSLISCFIFAQEEWTALDSIKLSKILNGEISIYINDTFKKELEQSFTGSLSISNNRDLKDFLSDIKLKNRLTKYPQFIKSNFCIECQPPSERIYNKKIGRLKINSIQNISNQTISIERNINLSIPLSKKLDFNIYGNYTIDKKRNVVLPAVSIPYVIGGGVSYKIRKHTIIKSQTNYQYNIIQKRWEWFFGVSMGFSF